MPRKTYSKKTHVKSPYRLRDEAPIDPERMSDVAKYVESLAADNIPEGVPWKVTHDKKTVTLAYDRAGVSRSSWIPKTYKGVKIIRAYMEE